MEQRINGVLTAECDDEDTTMRRSTGIIALQLHAGFVMKVQFKNIKICVSNRRPSRVRQCRATRRFPGSR